MASLTSPRLSTLLILVSFGITDHHSAEVALTDIEAAYGMGLDIGTFLAVYGTAFDGNPLSLTPGYSIGGPTGLEAVLGGLLGTPTGLSGSHNNYETDTSPTRGDLYVT